ncbi:hypothetical protein [Paenibacillus sp. NPDC055715]
MLLPNSELNRPANEMLKLLLIVSAIGILLIMGALLVSNLGMVRTALCCDESGNPAGGD